MLNPALHITGSQITRTLGVVIAILCATLLPSIPAFSVQKNEQTYSNRLIHSSDPYLLLHAHNPVDWYPWGEEALARAKKENKLIFVSIGYSTCYWCHVAEREIYSNPEIAKLMNQWFINIKVDREQRPDIDRIYMLATQMMTGQGGWPNNVFLTPDLKPVYAGSYFPPEDQPGRPGFPRILTGLHQAWVDDNDKILSMAEQAYLMLQHYTKLSAVAVLPDPTKWIDQAVRDSTASFDELDGGFGHDANKFPESPRLIMLLANASRYQPVQDMVTATLDGMLAGGIMDHLAGGFHRYSVEPSWSIPHFEKMLYDNAQLLSVYAQAYAITKKPQYRLVALRTAHYLMTEMQAPSGGFFSAQDAEVAGVEGESYVWTREQIEHLLGTQDANRWFELYDITPMLEAPAGHAQPQGGVLRIKDHVARQLVQSKQLTQRIEKLAPLRNKLLAARLSRTQPLRDEKIISADNALAIIAFAQAGQALQQPELTRTAVKTADWLWHQGFDPKSGDLRHQFYRGQAGDSGFLDDYASLARAFMVLYHSTTDRRWLSRAQQITDAMLRHFAQDNGMLSSTRNTQHLLMAPPVDGDSVKPSGQSSAITVLLDLSVTLNKPRYAEAAHKALLFLTAQLNSNPSSWGELLTALSEPKLRSALTSINNTRDSVSIDSANYVQASGNWINTTGTYTLEVNINIDAGYHINANPASESYLIATQLIIAGHPDIKVEYPAALVFKPPFAPQGIAVYQGRISLRAYPDLSSSQLPAASLRVQACNEKVCLAPATIDVPIRRAQGEPE